MPAAEIHRARRYRLMAHPPFIVAFPSIRYRVAFQPIEGCPQAELCAFGDGQQWSMHRTHGTVLERDVFELGFDLMHPTVPSLIADRLCAMGCAVRLS